MKDRVFEVSLIALTVAVLVWIVAGSVLGAMGYPWADMDIALLIFLTILIGLVVLIVGGCAMLWAWGKTYMARG